MNNLNKRIAIIGSGISGLAAAYRLINLNPSLQVRVFEANHYPGGAIQTVERDGFLIERGADSFITNIPWAKNLCQQLGFENQLMSTNKEFRGAYVVRRGRLHKIPAGFQLMATPRLWPIITTRLLSSVGKLRLVCERFLPPKQNPDDESLADFASRRLGREAYERLVEPLVGGIYTSDARKLSIAATLPQFMKMEQQWGNLTRGMYEKSKADGSEPAHGARYELFVAPRRGMQSLVQAIVAQLPNKSLQLETSVGRIEPTNDGRWKVFFADRKQTEYFDGVIAAVPTYRTATLLGTLHTKLSEALTEIEYASSVVVSLGVPRNSIAHPLDGFGLVVPAVEKRSILAASFSSVKFPERAPEDMALIRVFIGGALRPELVDRDNQEIISLAIDEMRDLIRLRGEPIICDLTRWPAAMPQYHVGHIERVGRIKRFVKTLDRFEVAGSAYDGVGIPHSIHSGEQAADRLVDALTP